jgi:hypothetical protein
MSEKSPRDESDYQGQLLTLVDADAIIPREVFPDEPREKLLGDPITYEIVYGEKGSYKDLKERSEELLASMGTLSLRNQRIGFSMGSVSPHHNGRIYGEYRERVPFIQRGADRKVDEFLVQAKRQFWHATGFSAMRGTGLMTDQQINTYSASIWEKFSARYGTPIKDEDRVNLARPNYQKKLKGLIKMVEAVELKKARHEAA